MQRRGHRATDLATALSGVPRPQHGADVGHGQHIRQVQHAAGEDDDGDGRFGRLGDGGDELELEACGRRERVSVALRLALCLVWHVPGSSTLVRSRPSASMLWSMPTKTKEVFAAAAAAAAAANPLLEPHMMSAQPGTNCTLVSLASASSGDTVNGGTPL